MDKAAFETFLHKFDVNKYFHDHTVKDLVEQLKNRVDTLDQEAAERDQNMADPEERNKMKLLVVGDGVVGKTCLLCSYKNGEFPEKYVPTVFENYIVPTKWNSMDVHLHVWDTAGQDEYDRLRPLSYPGTDVVLICYSTISNSSFESVKSKWHPEIVHYLPNAIKILVGTKIDLREARSIDPNTGTFEPVTTEAGVALAKKLKMYGYMEVSAKTRVGLTEVFDAAIESVMRDRYANDPEPEPDTAAPAASSSTTTTTSTTTPAPESAAAKPAIITTGEKPKKKKEGGCNIL
ncbi:Rho GTPase [Pelomyxa schiedti]|nr:Rho GTPase [Pelomyxa schiedti]